MPKAVKKALVLLPVILLCVLVFAGISAASREAMKPGSAQALNKKYAHVLQDCSDRGRVICLLESKIGSHRLPEQAKEKLAIMPEEEFRLIAALCDRIEAANGRAGTDLALLLAAALIVLS